MRRWFHVTLTSFVLVALLGAGPLHAAADEHLQPSRAFVSDLADRAIETLTDADTTKEQRRDRFRELFREGFAISGIARYALGRYWRRASKTERAEYLALFEDVTVNTWADRFADYSGQTFEVDGVVDVPVNSGKERVAIVRSTFFTDPQTPVRIEWRVASVGNLYKITDVTVEGISMATTQRDEFIAVIRNNDGDMNGLIAELRKRRDG